MNIHIVSTKKTYDKFYKRNKRYALKGVSFEVETGQIYALVGQNGAGKSTLIKCLLGFISLDKGEILLDNVKRTKSSLLNEIGFMPEFIVYPSLVSLREYLTDFGILKGIPKKELKETIGILCEKYSLTEFLDSPISNFSKGMRKKVGFIISILSIPKLLILDEPTDGLDPITRKILLSNLIDLKEQGCTILITSHILSDLQTVSDKVGLLHEGIFLDELDLKDYLRSSAAFEVDVKYNNEQRQKLSFYKDAVIALDDDRKIEVEQITDKTNYLDSWYYNTLQRYISGAKGEENV